MEFKNTHVMVNNPEISVRYLADYMAGTERRKRSIATDLKYRPVARLIQHSEARGFLTSFIIDKKTDSKELIEKSEFIRAKLASDDFNFAVNEANADYLQRVSQILGDLKLPNANLTIAQKFSALSINGVKVTFAPHIALDRVSKTNKTQRGAMMFRYAKNTPLNPTIAKFQCSAIFGVMRELAKVTEADEIEKSLCITVDAYTGTVYDAPGNAVTDFNNMKAALSSITERWPNIPAPKNAVF